MRSVYDLDEPADAMPVPSPRRRVARRLAVVGVVVAAAWLAMAREPRPAERPPAVTGAARTVAIAKIAEGAEAVAAPATEPGMVELCGLAQVAPASADHERGGHDLLEAPLREAERKTIARLLAQSDERSRAAGHFLRAASLGTASAVAHPERLHREGIDCSRGACEPPPVVDEVTQAREALARLAVASRDPWIYGLAYQGCTTPALPSGAIPACQLVSIERWTQLEPDNAIAWLHAASDAQQRGDAASVAEALYRASQAKRADARAGLLGAVARPQHPGALAPAVGLALDTQAFGFAEAFAIPGYHVVSLHCAKDALTEPNRRAVCEALAGMLVERSTSLVDLSLGLVLGKRLEWPTQRLEAIETTRDALYATALDIEAPASDGAPRLDCEAVAARREHLRRMAELGELGALRERLARSGDAAALAARHRAAMARLHRQAAAPPASAAPPDGMLRTASTTP